MAVFERALTPDIQASLPGAAREGAALLGIPYEADPAHLVGAIDAFVLNPPKAGFFKRVDNWNERAMPLGALWGVQLERRFGWQWAMLEEDGETSIGIVDPLRSMAVYPFDYVYGCLEQGGVPTIHLAFNMLAAGQLPPFPDRAFESIMDGIRHIVPPF